MVIFYHQRHLRGRIVEFRSSSRAIDFRFWAEEKVDAIIISKPSHPTSLANPILFVIEKIAFAKSLFYKGKYCRFPFCLCPSNLFRFLSLTLSLSLILLLLASSSRLAIIGKEIPENHEILLTCRP